MRRRNDYVKCLAKVLELGVLMNTPIKKSRSKKYGNRYALTPIYVHIGLGAYDLFNIKHIKSLKEGTKTAVITYDDGENFVEDVPFLEALEILKKGGE